MHAGRSDVTSSPETLTQHGLRTNNSGRGDTKSPWVGLAV